MIQLSLFEPLSIESANRLIDLLNEGRKIDRFKAVNAMHVEGGLLLLTAYCKQYGYMYNIVDEKGDIPKGYSANWRTGEHIKQELGL